MSVTLRDLETEALKLPPEERALLAAHLIASVYDDHEVGDAWAEEVARRVAAVESGVFALVTADPAVGKSYRTSPTPGYRDGTDVGEAD
jgi:hypothetical protein